MEKLNNVRIFQGFFLIEFLKNRLEVLKIGDFVLNLFIVKVKIIFNSTLSCTNISSKVSKVVLKKNLELSLRQQFYLLQIFVLIVAGTDLSKKADKRDIV